MRRSRRWPAGRRTDRGRGRGARPAGRSRRREAQPRLLQGARDFPDGVSDLSIGLVMAVHPPRVVGDLLREQAQRLPDKPYLGCGDERLTFSEADRRTDAVAAGLAELGIGPGDRVATIASNRMEMLECFFACAKLGAILVPMNVFLKGDFLQYQLADSQASTLLVDAPGWQSVEPLLADLSELKRIVAFDEIGSAPVETIAYQDVRESGAPIPSPELEPSSPLS